MGIKSMIELNLKNRHTNAVVKNYPIEQLFNYHTHWVRLFRPAVHGT